MLAAALGWRLAACPATMPCALPALWAALSSQNAAALLDPPVMGQVLRPRSFTSLAQLPAAAPAAPAASACVAQSCAASAATAAYSNTLTSLLAARATSLAVAAAVAAPAWQHNRLWHTASVPRRRLFSSGGSIGDGSSGSGGGQGRRRQRVAVGISGGVDSAVAALLLKEQGYDVVGVFMRNWDEGEEVGNQNCSVEADARDAAAVCRQLGLPLVEADFVSQYWTQVFEEFVEQCGRGLTPNPDLACNRHIKFDALLRFADRLGADLVATGHYARIRRPTLDSSSPPHSSLGLGLGLPPILDRTTQHPPASTPTPSAAAVAARPPPAPQTAAAAAAIGATPPATPQAAAAAAAAAIGATPPATPQAAGAGAVQLLKGLDPSKDQTYFLASIQPQALERVLFPVGGMLKGAVRELAAERGLLPADRRSSAGICFIGRRNFADFISQYVPPVPGTYVSVDTGEEIGQCPNILTVTHGQRPGIGGAAQRVYVVGKDVVSKVVYVCQGRDHPALLTRTTLLRTPHWLSTEHAQRLAEQGWLRCEYKARYGHESKGCTLYPAGASEAAASFTAADSGGLGGGGSSLGKGGSSSSTTTTTEESTGTVAQQQGQQQQEGQQQEQQEEEEGRPPVFLASAYTQLAPQDAVVLPGYLLAVFDEPAAAITPQQAFVMYDGEVCLGSAPIARPGRTLFEEGAAAF